MSLEVPAEPFPLRTEPFRVGRLELAYLGVAEYLRTYWWFAAIVPLFGILMLVLAPGVMKAMGVMALLWPFSLPARAIVATSKAGKLMERGVWASLEDGVLYLHGEGTGLKLSLAKLRRVERRRNFLVLSMARGDFLALPLRAVSTEFAGAIENGAPKPI